MMLDFRKTFFTTVKMEYSRTPPYRSSRDLRIFTFISGSPLKRGKITLTRFNWDQKILTFIDGSPLKAGLLSRCITIKLRKTSTLKCHIS